MLKWRMMLAPVIRASSFFRHSDLGLSDSAMSFPFNFFAAAFLGAFVTSLLALPLWRKWCLRTNLVDDPGHLKIHDSPVPLAGGLAVLTGILLPFAAGAILLKLGAVKISSAGLIVHGIDRRAI